MKDERLESLLSVLLQYGTWLASAIIATGIGLALFHAQRHPGGAQTEMDMRIAAAGVLLFIVLPALRVFVMLLAFLRTRQYGLAAAAGLVLAIILLGVVMGQRKPGAG